MVPLAGARVRPERRAAPSSGSVVVPYGPRRKTNDGETLLFPRGVQTMTGGGDGMAGPQVGTPSIRSLLLSQLFFPRCVQSTDGGGDGTAGPQVGTPLSILASLSRVRVRVSVRVRVGVSDPI